jgi:hypothetical protein
MFFFPPVLLIQIRIRMNLHHVEKPDLLIRFEAKSRIRIKVKSRELWLLTIELWTLTLEP